MSLLDLGGQVRTYAAHSSAHAYSGCLHRLLLNASGLRFPSHVRLQAAGNSGSPGPPDPDGPVAAGAVGLVGGGLLRCCARTPAGAGEDDVFGKKWVAVYDATGAGLRRALHKPQRRSLLSADAACNAVT